MPGLLLKDLYLNRRFAGLCAAFLGAGILLCILEPGSVGDLLYALTFALALAPAFTLRSDCLARWEGYAACTPVGRRGVVSGKYLLALLTALIPFPALLLLRPLALLPWLTNAPLPALLRTAGLCSGFLLTSNALILPQALRTRASDGGGSIFLLLPAFFAFSWAVRFPGPLLLGCAPLVTAAFLLSWRLALHIYEKKEL